MPADLAFSSSLADLNDVDTLLVFGRKNELLRDDVLAALPASLDVNVYKAMVNATRGGDSGRTTSSWTTDKPAKVVIGVLPEACSRHNSPTRAWAIPGIVKAALRKGTLGVLAALEDPGHGFAVAAAIARALPLFNMASPSNKWKATAVLLGSEGALEDTGPLDTVAEAVRRAARMVDTPPDIFNVDAFVSTAKTFADARGDVDITVIRGEELREAGLGGLYGVGRAATEPPALIVLDWAPEGATSHQAWVGKGIVYDTGGLSIKGKTGMPGMKSDMAGAAAVLASFLAAVELKAPQRLTAVLCVAENAIGHRAIRPDDVLSMLSGKKVEVNNTDAEGRLVLADGLAWVVANREPDSVIDLATLTGAQLVATGRLHAALYANGAEIEGRAIEAGRASGELVHPLPFAPELFRKEFQSKVADLRNSVKDRANGQSSCAGQFIYEHIGEYKGEWLHVDMAGPGFAAQRATGWGPALLLTMLGVGA
ncbi:MAG: leucyl aminopeptidase family protein [Proteobacteria bacterium]|nr:leucyl aminopeptidase family protein [Pseudomonadota bacterium]